MAVGQAPACVKTCPTGAIQFGTKEDMKDYAAKRVADLKERGFANAGCTIRRAWAARTSCTCCTTPTSRGSTPACRTTRRSARWSSLWKGFAKPLATLALAGVALGSLFHYVTKGPNEVSKETEDEIEKEDAK